MVVAVLMLLMMFAVHCTWVTSNAYSSPSIVLASYGNDGSRQVRALHVVEKIAKIMIKFLLLIFVHVQILDDFREAYYWLWQNTAEDARVMSWWDYGYQVSSSP